MRRLEPAAILDFHRRLVGIPSTSGDEEAAAAFVAGFLADRGARVERLERNVLAWAGGPGGPRLLLDSHLDTVPPSSGWTREPWRVEVEAGRVYGLGANDAKASVAAMVAALLAAGSAPAVEVALLLVADEETGGRGTELAWPALRDRGFAPDGVVVGEPTGLDVAVAQKGMLILELVATGDACHVAHARSRGATNAIRSLARDLLAAEAVDLGPPHPELGSTTLEPTLVGGGTARNVVPERASATLDLRTVPGLSHEELVARLRRAVGGEIFVSSKRLAARECRRDAAVVRAARRARPEARLFGSPTMSDLVFFEEVPAIKCGPGRSERSHTPDEYVREEEILAGAAFYEGLIAAFAGEGAAAG